MFETNLDDFRRWLSNRQFPFNGLTSAATTADQLTCFYQSILQLRVKQRFSYAVAAAHVFPSTLIPVAKTLT